MSKIIKQKHYCTFIQVFSLNIARLTSDIGRDSSLLCDLLKILICLTYRIYGFQEKAVKL